MEQYAGMDIRRIVTVLILSFATGLFSSLAGMMLDPDAALIANIAVLATWFIFFLFTVDLKDLFSGHDFFEVLTIYFLPYMVAFNLPWVVSTVSLVILFIIGIILIRFLKKYRKI